MSESDHPHLLQWAPELKYVKRKNFDLELEQRRFEYAARQGLSEHEVCWGKPPFCTDLLRDPGSALSDRQRWPNHLCYEAFLRESTERWVRQSTVITGVATGRVGTIHPLPVGKRAVSGNRFAHSDEDWREVFQLVPFDGNQEALWALRIEGEDSALDLFGLATYPTDEHKREEGAMMGELTYVLRGGDTSLLSLLRAARQWWSRFRGLPMGGRPINSGVWDSGGEFREAAQMAVRELRARGEKTTQEAVADFFSKEPGFPNCTDRQLRHWCSHYGFGNWKNLIKNL